MLRHRSAWRGLVRAGSSPYGNLVRSFSGLRYEEHGQPENVLALTEARDQRPGNGEVLVQWLAAPINPADINQIQGTYGIRPSLPATPGNEGVGVIEDTGSDVQGLQRGDRVVALRPGLGTWTEASVHDARALHKVSERLPLAAAATLAINPATAKRLLEDVVKLEAGDVVIQNGANSFVGQFLVQIAARKKLRTVNLVRDRPDFQDLVKRLRGLGADLVTTEQSLRRDLEASGLGKPSLAINSVGGRSSTSIARSLGKNGTIVTYGGMSKEPVILPTGPFIFKGLKAQGFWLSGGGRTDAQAAHDIDEAAQLWMSGDLQAGFDYFDLEDFKAALSKPKSSLLARKTILLTQRGRQLLEKT